MENFDYVPNFDDLYTGVLVVPAGEYKVQIIDAVVHPPKSGDGKYLYLKYEVIGDPRYDKNIFYDNLCVSSSNKKAEIIGNQKINTICFLTGIPAKNIGSPARFCGKTLSLLIGVEFDEDKKPKSNFIKKYLPLNGNTPSQPVDSDSEQPRSFIKK